ncbi:head GIN domain-containing protein [Chitinimonas sp.]|uniref:head GIN domain-containing protein n=1 Tax=Chitinimonas sp. TaxID=1934313 RepID=UPI0035AED447
MQRLFALLAGISLTACGIQIDHDEKTGDIKSINVSVAELGERGNGSEKTETRSITAVSEVQADGAIDVEVSIGDTPSLTVSGDANLLKLIVTEQQGSQLRIRAERSFSSNNPVRVKLVTPALKAARHAGSGELAVDGLKGGDFALDVTGSGDTRLAGKVDTLTAHLVGSGDLDADQLQPGKVDLDVLGSGDVSLGRVSVDTFKAAVKGSGSVTASGSAKQLTGNVLGSGDLNLGDLHAEAADVSVMGSGDIAIFASQSVKATASGSGEVTVAGKPAKTEIHGENVSLQ